MEQYKPLEMKHYMVFEVAEHKYAIDVLDIDSIHSSNDQSLIDNIADLRMAVRLYKRLVPIINMREKLQLESAKKPVQPSVVFLKKKDGFPNDIFGMKVDNTLDILEIMVPKDASEKPSRLVKTVRGIRSESVQILKLTDVIEKEEHVPVRVEIMN